MAYVARTVSDETQTLVGQVGEISVNNPSHIVVTADMSSATWNTVATHEVFTVTGLVRMQLWFVCTESLASGGAATIKFGYETNTGDTMSAKAYTLITAGYFLDPANELWRNISGYTTTFYGSGPSLCADLINYGLDIGYEIEAAALTNGTLEWHCIWTPLTAGATVVAGAGGTL